MYAEKHAWRIIYINYFYSWILVRHLDKWLNFWTYVSFCFKNSENITDEEFYKNSIICLYTNFCLSNINIPSTYKIMYRVPESSFVKSTKMLVIITSLNLICSFEIINNICMYFQFSSVQSLSCVWFFATPWIAARQASLSITNTQSYDSNSGGD